MRDLDITQLLSVTVRHVTVLIVIAMRQSDWFTRITMSLGWKLKPPHKTGSTTRDVAVLTMGTAVAQLITIVAVPFLSRIYTPEDFGVLATFMAVATITATLITGRYEMTILLPSREDEAATLVLLSLILTGTFSTAMAVASFAVTGGLQHSLGVSAIGTWLPGAFMVAGAAGVIATTQVWMNRHRTYRQMSIVRVVQSTLIVCFSLLFAWSSMARDGLILAHILSYAAVASLAMWLARSATTRWDRKQLRHTAKTHIDSPRYLLPTAVLDIASLQLPIFLVTAKFGTEIAGHYSMAVRILSVPLTLVGSAIGQVFFQRAAIDIDTNPRAVYVRYIQISITLGILSIPLTILIIRYGSSIFEWALGSAWTPTGQMAEFLVISATMYFIFSPTSSILLTLQKQKVLLAFGVIQFAYRTGTIYFANNAEQYIITLTILETLNVAAYTASTTYLLNNHIKARAT